MNVETLDPLKNDHTLDPNYDSQDYWKDGPEMTKISKGFHVNLFLVVILPLLCILDKFLSKVSSWISGWFFQPTELERGRFEEAVKLKAEMKKLSMVDDFAAYSKIQRRLNLVTLGLETDGGARQALRANLARTISIVLYGILGIWYLILLTTHGTSTPVLVLPSEWFYPLGRILAFPTGISGGVSLVMWSLISRTVITQFI